MFFKQFIVIILIILNLGYSSSFFNIINPIQNFKFNLQKNNGCNIISNERLLYAKYLIALRKTKKLLNYNKNIEKNAYIASYNEVTYNNTDMKVKNIEKNAYVASYKEVTYNNTDMKVKNILMENIVLDVSNIKYIHIVTKNDKIIVELDKKTEYTDMFTIINNLDTYINIISLFGKIANIN